MKKRQFPKKIATIFSTCPKYTAKFFSGLIHTVEPNKNFLSNFSWIYHPCSLIKKIHPHVLGRKWPQTQNFCKTSLKIMKFHEILPDPILPLSNCSEWWCDFSQMKGGSTGRVERACGALRFHVFHSNPQILYMISIINSRQLCGKPLRPLNNSKVA